jgi:hypothetical protein
MTVARVGQAVVNLDKDSLVLVLLSVEVAASAYTLHSIDYDTYRDNNYNKNSFQRVCFPLICIIATSYRDNQQGKTSNKSTKQKNPHPGMSVDDDESYRYQNKNLENKNLEIFLMKTPMSLGLVHPPSIYPFVECS